MKNHIIKKLLFPLCMCSVGVSAQVYELSEQSFDNPAFRARFAQSYIAESDVNPSITAEEKGLFDEIVPLVGSDPKRAIQMLETSITEKSSAAFDYILGNLLYQEDRVDESIKAYQVAIEKFPKYFRAYYNVGRAYVASGSYEAGLGYLQKAIEIQSGDGTLYGLIGYCYLNLDKPSTALDAYRSAIMLAPKSRDWRTGKLQCLIALGHTEEAIGMLYEFIAEEPENAEWWKLQANQFLASGNTAMAAANLTVLSELGKADGPSLTLLGDLMLNEGLIETAMDSYLAAMEKGGARPARMIEVVNSLIQLEQIESAKTLVSRVEGTIGSSLSDLHQLSLLNAKARIAMSDDDIAGAADYLKQVVDRDPMNGSALLALSDLEKKRGNLAKAEYYAENASKIDSYAHRAYLSLAQLNVGKRDYRSAAKYLRNAQDIEPKEYVADYLLRVEQAAMRL